MSKQAIRRPAVAGQFYPADPGNLRREVQSHIGAATLPEELGPVRAVIAPHAGYVYSGPTAGYAFKSLEELPRRDWTVFLLGPAHRVPFRGVALSDHSAFRTPLGEAPIALERVNEMLDCSRLYTLEPDAHAPEHCLEVVVPFLQVALSEFRLVPMLFGQVDHREVAVDLVGRIGENDLIVVSTDLSHFYPDDTARDLDQEFLDALLAGEEHGVMGGEACGRAPVGTLVVVAERKGWTPHLLDYRTSADTAGDSSRVVGYAAVAYTA